MKKMRSEEPMVDGNGSQQAADLEGNPVGPKEHEHIHGVDGGDDPRGGPSPPSENHARSPNGHPRRPPSFRRISQYPEQVVGALGRLLDKAAEFADLAELRDQIAKRHPGDLKYFAPAVAELGTAGTEPNPKNVLRVMGDNKAIEFYQRDKESALRGLNGIGTSTPPNGSQHALILPVPPDVFYLLEDITPGKLYLLPGHHIPHELDAWEVAELPTRSRAVKAELAGVESIAFAGFIDRQGKILTRREITDLLADLADLGVKPVLLIVEMPHRPHHENFEAIEDGYRIEIFA
jgi:hypothetical protein